MKKYRFYRTDCPITGDRRWWIDLPRFPFDKSWLEMVLGADTLLDIISEGKEEVFVRVSQWPFFGWDYLLVREKKLGLMEGALYESSFLPIKNEDFGGENILWLCPVTLWVFLRYPKKIYIKII